MIKTILKWLQSGPKWSQNGPHLLLAYVGICWHMLAYVGICWHMLAYVGICWHLLAYVGVKYHEPPIFIICVVKKEACLR